MKKPVFTGACTALVTPFSNGKVDYSMLRKLLQRQMAAGIHAVVLCGTTGEAPTLTDEEKLTIFQQAKEFNEVADITGIVLTKMDGTAKGGIAVAIQAELGIPVKYIGVGESIDDLQKFDSDTFVNALFTSEQTE